MSENSEHSHLYTSLIQAVTASFSASDFCRNLVHSVLKDLEANAALICKLALDSSLVEVGSYGMELDNLKAHLTNVFDENPLALAVRRQQPIFAMTGTEVALPLQQDGLVSGGMLIAFGQQQADQKVPKLLIDSLQVAGAHFLEKGKMHNGRNGNGGNGVKSDQSELTSRQLQILAYLDQPMTYAQIGRLLHVSESLVKQEAGRVFRFLEVANRKDAVAVAQARELLPQQSNS